jgi:hypothetical protein
VPHIDYEDSQIAPYKIRLQYFDPPEAILIVTDPETPTEDVETKVVVYPENMSLVAAGWLSYSLDGAGPMIIKMVPSGETLVGNLGLLEAGTTLSYEVYLQDYFFNTDWSALAQAEVIFEFPQFLILPLFMIATLLAWLHVKSRKA